MRVFHWPKCDVAIAMIEMRQQHLAAIGGLPVQQSLLLGAHAPPQAGCVDMKTIQDLRHLADVAKRIRNIANHHPLAKDCANLLSDQQVADDSLGGDQKLIGQDVPGTNQDPVILNVFLQARKVAHAHLQVILKNDGLSVQHEMQICRVGVEQGQEVVNQVHQLQPELLKSFVPFPIPMRV